VSDEELPSAATLGGLQLNISGILGRWKKMALKCPEV
jgi:hypothetical protein